MAVENKYVNSDVAAGKLAKAIHSNGGKVFAMIETFEVAVADDDGSVYRLFKNLPPDLIPLSMEVYNDAITGGTDYDIGFYETGVAGAVIDKDKLADGLDMSSAAAKGSPKDGLAAVGLDEIKEMIYELAGHTTATRKTGYDLAITANTVGAAAGTISVVALFGQG